MERVVYEKKGISFTLDLVNRFLSGRNFGNTPPLKLYLACVCLLLTFLFIPMGTLPQFFSTDFDVLVIIFLFATAQSFFIRGMRSFSEEIYQTLDKNEVSALSRFITAYILTGGTVAWYVLSRGIPGNIFSFDALTATPLWSVMGTSGCIGFACLFILLAICSPCRRTESITVYYNVPLPEMFDALRSTLCPAIATAVFLSYNPAVYFGLYGWRMFMVGFAYYWFQVFMMQIFIFPLIWRCYQRAKSLLPERYDHAIIVTLAALGVCGLMMDLYV